MLTSPVAHDDDGTRMVAQVKRQGCALILSSDPDGNQLYFNYPNDPAAG